MDGLYLRSNISPDDVRAFPNECAGRRRPCALIGQAYAHEIIKTPFLRHEVVGLGEHSGLNPSRLQGTQALWVAADLQDCDILHRSQSEPLEGDAGHKIAQPTKEGNRKQATFELLSGFN